MKKRLIIFLSTALAFYCANTLSGQARFGFKAGLNMAELSLSEDYFNVIEFVEGADFKNKLLPLFHAGAVVEFGFGSNFGLGTGVQLSIKGGKQEFKGVVLNVPYTRTKNINLIYLQLPLMLHYRNSGFYAGIGPYFGYAIGGSMKIKTKSGDASSERTEHFDFGNDQNDDFSAIDYGGAFELGYEFFGRLRLSASYSLGLANVLPADAVDAADNLGGNWSANNNIIGVSLTYLFGSE